jgi:hypothetical protein
MGLSSFACATSVRVERELRSYGVHPTNVAIAVRLRLS